MSPAVVVVVVVVVVIVVVVVAGDDVAIVLVLVVVVARCTLLLLSLMMWLLLLLPLRGYWTNNVPLNVVVCLRVYVFLSQKGRTYRGAPARTVTTEHDD